MGRPSDYKAEYAEQAEKLCKLGATDIELADFFALLPEEDDWLYACLLLIRQDRRGIIACQKRDRSVRRARVLTASSSHRIRNSISARLWASLKGRTDGVLFSRLGYSSEELVEHLEAQFTDGMTWANYGRWHIDHKKPCATFDLADPAQFDECWALANLRPLWAGENIKKGAKYVAA